MTGVPLSWYLILSAVLFVLGVAGFLFRRNIITVFMSIELMLNAVNLSFIAFSYQLKQVDGHLFAFFVMVVAAAEAAVGLAIILTVFKNRSTLNVDDVNAIAIGSVLLSFAWVLKTLLALGAMETAYVERYGTWFQSGALRAGFDLSVDRLTAVMLLVVTGIGSLIHIYATGYMSHEGGYYRFFAFLNLFMFFMLV